MLKGTLEEFALADVFRLISWAKKTGKLEVARSAGQGKIFFRDGEVYYAQSSISREPLGQKLIRAGALTEGHLMKALDQNAQTGERVGRVLVDNGWVNDAQLEAALRQQIEDAVFDLLRWELGDFEFESSVEADIEVQISVSVENLIIEASRRLDELEVIQRKIPSEAAILKMSSRPPEGAAEINITPEEWRMLVLVDGSRSVHEIAKLVGLDDFGALRGLYGLVSAGLVEVMSAQHQQSGGSVPDQAFRDEERGALEPRASDDVVPAEPSAIAPPPTPVAAPPPQVETPVEPPETTMQQPETPVEPPETTVEPPEATMQQPETTVQPAREAATEPAPDTGGSAFKQSEEGWDEATMSSVFHVEDPLAGDEAEPANGVTETRVPVEGFDAPGPDELVESKPDPFLNDLLGGVGTSAEPQAQPAPEPEPQSPPEEPSAARQSNPAPPAPSAATPQVDRTTVVRELAGLFHDDEYTQRPVAEEEAESGTEGDDRKRVEDDDELNKGLITRLIDGVKGL